MISVRPQRSVLLHRLTVMLSLALVVALNILAVRPDLHAALHAASDTHGGCSHHGGGHAHPASDTNDDYGCVIEAFEHGKAGFDATPIAMHPAALAAIASISPLASVPLAAPAFALPPGCGPPAV